MATILGMNLIYLDNNATTKPADLVVEKMTQANQQLWGNPSSVHRFGQEVRQQIELARAQVAKLIGGKPREIIFTSGGTESNNLAIRGLFERSSKFALITTKIEHSAVREPASYLEKQNCPVIKVAANLNGQIDSDQLEQAIKNAIAPHTTILVSIQWANNETGTIQDIPAIAQATQNARDWADSQSIACKVLFHVDGTQAAGKLPINASKLGIDLLTIAGHKFHGPKGSGALWIRQGIYLKALQLGGPQERERRGGTENTVGIIGLGVAAQLASEFVADTTKISQLQAMRNRFEDAICNQFAGDLAIQINCKDAPRLWNTSNIAFPRLEAEAILVGLSEKGLCASAGAACSSGSLEPSPVLRAMGIPEHLAHGSVRFSLSRFTTEDELNRAVKIITDVVERLRKTMPI